MSDNTVSRPPAMNDKERALVYSHRCIDAMDLYQYRTGLDAETAKQAYGLVKLDMEQSILSDAKVRFQQN